MLDATPEPPGSRHRVDGELDDERSRHGQGGTARSPTDSGTLVVTSHGASLGARRLPVPTTDGKIPEITLPGAPCVRSASAQLTEQRARCTEVGGVVAFGEGLV